MADFLTFIDLFTIFQKIEEIYCLLNTFWLYKHGVKYELILGYSLLLLQFFKWNTLYEALCLEKIEAMSCIVRAQRRVCKRRVTLGHGLEWAHKIQTETQIDLIETRIRNGLVRRGRSLPSIFAAWLRPTCHLGDFRTFMYKMMHPPPSETTRCYATWVLVRVGTLKLTTLACLLLTKNNLATVLSENN